MCPYHQGDGRSFLQAISRSSGLSLRFALQICFTLVLTVMLIPLASCGNSVLSSQTKQDPLSSGFRIESTAFAEGKSIPKRFTCEGANVSPTLRWSDPPSGTRSFALIVEDPDAPAGIWTHWVAYDLPAGARGLPERVPKQELVPGGGHQGLNSFGHTGYGGPCPPPGNAHRYFFRLYALDTMLSLKPGASKEAVLAAVKGHILGETQLMGKFKR